MEKKKIQVGSLFSGIGGIELGLERTGHYETKWFVEKEEYCQRILKHHWPGIKVYDDITKLDFHKLPPVDMLTGGFPCQDISVAGKGAGIERGTRSGLWRYYAEAIRVLRPRVALIENVPAIVGRGLNIVLADLAQAGYDAEWLDLRASDFGALHKRERIFIIAYPDEQSKRDRVHARESESERQSTTHLDVHGRERERLLLLEGRPQQENSSHEKRDTPDTHRAAAARQREHRRPAFQYAESEGHGNCATADGNDGLREHADAKLQTRRPAFVEGFAAEYWRERIQGFTQAMFQRGEGFAWCQDVRRVEDLQGRPDIPQPLLRGKSHGISGRIHPPTPSRKARLHALGNAVVPDCAEFIGEIILNHRFF